MSGQSCWEKRATALSFTQGDREELSHFALKRDRSVRLNIRSLSGFRELWHHKRTGGRGKGGAGLGFCRLSLSLYIPQAWLGAGGGGGGCSPPSWSLALWGRGILKGNFVGLRSRLGSGAVVVQSAEGKEK